MNEFAGGDDSSLKWNANAAYGLIYKRKYFIEARYDYFSKVAGNDFSGLSISVGTKIFGISL